MMRARKTITDQRGRVVRGEDGEEIASEVFDFVTIDWQSGGRKWPWVASRRGVNTRRRPRMTNSPKRFMVWPAPAATTIF